MGAAVYSRMMMQVTVDVPPHLQFRYVWGAGAAAAAALVMCARVELDSFGIGGGIVVEPEKMC